MMQQTAVDSEATALLPVDTDEVHQITASVEELEVAEPEAQGHGRPAQTAPSPPWHRKALGVISPSDGVKTGKSPPQREVLGYAGAFFYLSNALTGPGFFGFPKMLQVRFTVGHPLQNVITLQAIQWVPTCMISAHV